MRVSARVFRAAAWSGAPRFAGAHYFLKKLPLRAMVPQRLLAPLRRLAFRRGDTLKMNPADRRYLVDYYRDDIGKLAHLLDRDLSTWLRQEI